ncbi:tenascin isoform X2 [Oryzias melastigma]|uniref:tenascin isoform X2 n=1 Tax=Oryzias melastigma TaxID=30732 RepID=UPI000CF7D3A3|nr:tenascin isoform X2 [Oryzias melastigma]
MLPLTPCLLSLVLLVSPALLTPSATRKLQQTTKHEQDSIKVVISEGCATHGNSSGGGEEGKEIALAPGSPLVLTHKIKLVPSGSESCGCEADFAALRERLERLEREVSDLREKCDAAGGSCCTSESKGAGCSIKPGTDECPNECSDQGRCEDGKCVCFPGYSGPDCSESSCPENCSDKGKCVNGRCECDPGFTGPDCSQTSCPDNCSNKGRCVNGRCECDSGFTGPSCADKSCPGNCNRRGRCVNGQCVCNPGFTGPDCSKKACPNDCNNRGRCENGKCVCDGGFTGADCSEIACPGNCNNRGRCVNGQCVCNPGFTGTDCSKKACPDDCNNRGRCVNGKCVCDGGFTGADCSEIACPGNCNNRGRCVNGQCVCNPGFTGPDCSKKACPDDCSNHGRCVNGKCVCDGGFTGADCSEIACPGNCNNRGRCVNGQCVCNPGFTGPDCSKKACPDDCSNHGRCVNGKCVCDGGFTGADCSEIACPGNCNNRGRCVNGQCVCNPGFTGPDCSKKACPDDCSNHGRCVNGKCVCDGGFTGADCSEIACPGNCNNKGRCVNGQCVCNPGFTGPDCSRKACPDDCNNRGRCVNGKCVCDGGFTGADCSEIACPGNCNNRGRCVNGQCICEDGFTGEDCSERTCPNDCSDQGRCVNGRCECNSGFTGEDCSQNSCPDNCNNRGQCVDGKCVCREGFTGQDCSEIACPDNCSNNGKCVNGKCVCSVGFGGPNCATQVCPNNCSNRGRCMRGRCVCRRGFTGKDCSQCQEGMTGPDCDMAMSGVSQLRAQNITDTSVTLVWTPPSVQYETYYITFTSQKEGDQQITLQVEGHLTTFIQTGLAAGQKYSVTIVGELNGRRGTESMTEFMTLISGPTNLRVVKTTSTTAVVQWEPSQGDIDRYRLTISPREGAGRTREMTVGPGENSAHIQQLEAGRMYDIILVAEKGLSRSQPATTQAVPGKTIPGMTREALALQVSQAAEEDVRSMDQELNPSSKEQVFDQQTKSKERDEADSVRVKGSSDPNLLYSSTVIARTKPLPSQILTRNVTRPKDLAQPTVLRPRFPNRFRYNGTRGVPGGQKVVSGHPIKPPEHVKPGFARVKDSDGDKSLDPPIPGWRDGTHPAVIPANESERQKPEEPRSPLGPNVQPQSAIAEVRNDTGVFQNQEKKCVNRMTVKHLRLPLKDKLSGCRENGEGLRENSTTTDLKSASLQTGSDQDTTPDALHQLIRNTFDRMNITTISVHLSKPLNLSADAETVSKQIIGGMKPFSSLSSVSYSQPSLDSVNTKSASQTNLLLSSSSQSSSPSSPLSLSSLPPSLSSSNSDEFNSTGSDEMSVAQTKTATAPVSPENRKVPASEGGAFTPQRRIPHRGYNRHPPRNFRIPPKKTQQILRAPQDSRLNQTKEESLPSSSPPVELDSLAKNTMTNKGLTARLGSSGSEHTPTERRRFPVHRPPPRRIQPNQSFTRSQNQPSTSTRVSSPQETSNPKDPSPYDPEPSREDRKVGTRKPDFSTAFNHTTRGNGVPLSRPPNFNRPQNRTNMRVSLNRRPLPRFLPTKIPSSSRTVTGRQDSELGKHSTPDNQAGEQSLNTYGSQKTQSGEKDIVPTFDNVQIDRDSTNTRAKTHEAGREDDALIDTEKTSESYVHEEISNTGRGVGEKYKGIASHPTNDSAKTVLDTESERREDSTSAGEPLEFVRATNRTSDGFTVTWDAPEGKYEEFVVSSTEAEKAEQSPRKEDPSTQEPKNGLIVDDNNIGQVTKILSSNGAKPTESRTVLPGSARLHQFKDLPSQTEYTVTLLGMGSGLLSSLHKLVISTGPEPPTNIAFSKVTENSLTVSWTKPRSSVSGFKVTYTHADEVFLIGEPVSVTLDSGDSSLALSRLSPGSTYEVTIISTLGLDESDPIRDSVMTLPDPPTDLRAINVTDSTALLLWRPALAAVNKYAIVYGSETDSPVRVMVSGNAAEQQLSALQESTTYTVTITSQLGSLESSAATASFTTTSGRDADGPRDLLANNVTPRTATLSWKPPSNPVQSYLLTYQTEGQDIKEVIVHGSVTQYNLTRLHPGALYSVELIAIRGEHRPSISTKFKTGTLRFPFPTDCTQELLNGIRTSGEVEIFPQGKLGTPMMVYCDMETDGGGWIVFQRRKDGSEDFYRGWKDYVKGFGDLSREFWLGLEKIHNLSTMAKMILRVDLRDGGESVFAKYSTFEVAKRSYPLKVEGYSGTAGDSMSYHNGQRFSTKDRYPPTFITSCPMSYRGGWWYKNCHEANLNGLYGFDFKHQGIIWTSWKGTDHSIQFTEMKMRPAAFRPPATK